MTKTEILDALLLERKGILTVSDASAAGISKPYFYQYATARALEKVAHGVYLSSDAWVDELYLLQLRSKQIVFSHDTALYLHGLCDREPLVYTVTVKTGYNPSKLTANGVKVYSIQQALYEVGISQTETPFGHAVAVYNMERTICDIVRSRSKIETQTFVDGLQQYVRRKDKNLSLLMQYATQFRVEKILNEYLKVMLT